MMRTTEASRNPVFSPYTNTGSAAHFLLLGCCSACGGDGAAGASGVSGAAGAGRRDYLQSLEE